MNTRILIPVIILLAACGSSGKPNENPNNLKALEEIRKEAKVKEVELTDADVLYVSVEDDGTPRTGYAQYICQVLKENKATTSKVRVVKFASSDDPEADDAYGILLGESECK